ncbi:ABC transporter permease [Asticcacaulis sp.]|uniref:ABC transporter permease n=1 Tax=Asticcacaulis sp. TaxID=1872648 RepID=UPI002BFF7CFF|nr:ABC transporter permease [Asticcacaulis sp.]HTM81870.1 ABC transporter permease [Asticcacaulis sp.]
MNKTFLIARREYLAFVRTVGFWLSLFTLPLILGCSILIPILMRHSAPVETVAILDLSGDHIEGAIAEAVRAHAPKPGVFDDGGLRLAPLPAGLSADMPASEAEAKIPAIIGSGQVASIIVATDSGDKLHFRIWSADGHKGKVENLILWDLHGLQYFKLAGMHGIDHGLAHDMRESRADIVSLTPASADAPKKDGFAEGVRENGGRFLGIGISYLTWITIFSSSMILLGSVIEEKSSKVLEVLLASASTESLLVGKVLGVAGVMLTVSGLWAVTAFALSTYGFNAMPAETSREIAAAISGLLSPVHVALLLAYFTGGYLMFGVFFAAVGAFCETQKDAQAIIGPMTIVLMIPMMTMQVAFTSPDLPMLQYMSWFPLFTPFLMPLRLAQPLPWYEIAGTLAGMGVVALIMIAVGRRAFKAGALTGGKLSWGMLFRIATRKASN